MRLFALFVVLATSIIGFSAPPASAALCEKVWTTGTVLGAHSFGGCDPYGGATICQFEDAGADPQAHVYTEVCVPAP
jgi:hypothetical protein